MEHIFGKTQCSQPEKQSLRTGCMSRALKGLIVVARTMKPRRGDTSKENIKYVCLSKIIFVFFYICSRIMEILPADAYVSPGLWSWFLKKRPVFSLHCAPKLIYRSWPRLLFCATAILENNGRKARNLRGTESAVFHFFFLSVLIQQRIFPSPSKMALFLCPTGAINWCLSIPRPGIRAGFN